ncbi:MAG: IS3 family transposase [Acetobacterium woodii]|nr:IS3 family transposase [Acetobacterium woodii]
MYVSHQWRLKKLTPVQYRNQLIVAKFFNCP